jgi:transcriptional regulator with XRE-family HTH domain
MNIPTKTELAEYFRTEMARKNIVAKQMADKLKVTTVTVTNLKQGTASYQLYRVAIEALNEWGN